MRKRISAFILCLVIAVGTLTVIMPVKAQLPTEGKIFTDPPSLTWESPPHAAGETFDLEVRVTDVSDCYGVVFSIKWNTSIFELVGDPVQGDFLEEAGVSTAYMIAEVNRDAGYVSGVTYTRLGSVPGVTITSPDSGLVATLTFKVIATPAAGAPIITDITFEDTPDLPTGWSNSPAAGLVEYDFAEMAPFHFEFSVKVVPAYPPTASFTFTPLAPKVNETVTFDASASTAGWDGDNMCPITEYRWDFGDGTPQVVVNTPTVTHKYSAPGTYTVTLEVYAPGQPPYIDPAYTPTDTEQKDITVILVIGLILDLYSDKPAPYNGKGPNVPSDACEPQEELTLFAEVTYNGEGVQHKFVTFRVSGPPNPYYNFTFSRVAQTGADGVANITFRIPMPCQYPEESIFGNWTVTAVVEVADKVANDTMTFKVGWLVEIINIETGVLSNSDWIPKGSFKKGECIGVKLTVRNIGFTDRIASFSIVVYDDLGVPVAYWQVHHYTVPSGEKQIIIYCYLTIPKWAFVGVGTVYASALKDGTAYCPETSAIISIEKA